MEEKGDFVWDNGSLVWTPNENGKITLVNPSKGESSYSGECDLDE